MGSAVVVIEFFGKTVGFLSKNTRALIVFVIRNFVGIVDAKIKKVGMVRD